MRVGGQTFTPDMLTRIQDLVAAEPAISRRALAREVCQWLDWRSPNGQWQEGGCRKALAELARRGALTLPAVKVRIGARQPVDMVLEPVEVSGPLAALGAVELVSIHDPRSPEARLWRALIQQYHYLGDKPLCGAQLRYLIHSPVHGWLGALAFQAGCWALRDRDAFIGWSETARRHNLARVVCHSRFLLRPGVRVANLASHVLARAARQVKTDWAQRYGVTPVLLETFVDPSRFDGHCYRAANWLPVGTTAGRRDGIAKTVWLYPLQSRWRETLNTAPAWDGRPRPPAPTDWAEQEFGTLPLYDERLKRRVCTLARDFYNHPQAGLPEACGSKARLMGAYRFFNNSKVSMDVLLAPHTEATLERIKAHAVVLAPQDTTTLNYTHHPATSELGPVNTQSDESRGLILHDTVAFTVTGVPLGIVDAQCWARDPADRGKRARRKALAIEQKESMKWLRSYRQLAALQRLCPATQLVSIGDRESDVYALFAEARGTAAGPALLVRAERSRQRRVEQALLWDFMTGQTPAGCLELTLPKRGNRAARQAQLQVRYAPVELQPPKQSGLPALGVWAVHLFEPAPADGGQPIEWMLLTTVAVTTFEAAVERAQWYAARWGVEVYHRTLKSGCRIKDRQLGTAQRLRACLGIDMVVAWRIYHLSMLGRDTPDQPCTVFFDDAEWQALVCFHHKSSVVPETPPTMSEAVSMLGALGGHLGRNSDGPPGNQVLWRGLQKLDMAVQMYIVFTHLEVPRSWRAYPDGYLPPPNAP